MAEILIQTLIAILWTGFIVLGAYRVGFRHGLDELDRQYLDKKSGAPA